MVNVQNIVALREEDCKYWLSKCPLRVMLHHVICTMCTMYFIHSGPLLIPPAFAITVVKSQRKRSGVLRELCWSEHQHSTITIMA